MTLDDTIRQIAVIDDDPNIQYTVAYYLQQKGYHVLAYQTGAQAIEGLIKLRPRVALIDFGLPDINGIEVYKAVLAANVAVHPIFISGIIGYLADIKSYISNTHLGHLTERHFLAKPLVADELLARVQEFHALKFEPRNQQLPSISI